MKSSATAAANNPLRGILRAAARGRALPGSSERERVGSCMTSEERKSRGKLPGQMWGLRQRRKIP